uniref:Transmembrane protein n=1 Tax=Romanomermis culicivorax TaxID=13658 RepID=A0A915HQ94_ROMCU
MGDEVSTTVKIYYLTAAASCVALVTAATVYAMLVKRRKKSNDQSVKSFRNASAVTYDSAGHLKSIPFFVQHKMAPLESFRPSLKTSFSASESEGGLIKTFYKGRL